MTLHQETEARLIRQDGGLTPDGETLLAALEAAFSVGCYPHGFYTRKVITPTGSKEERVGVTFGHATKLHIYTCP